MHVEKLGQQQPRRVRQVRPRSALDLRKVALTQRLIHLLADRAHHLTLRHRTSQSAKLPFDFAEVSDFVAELHKPNLNPQWALIADCNERIANCNNVKRNPKASPIIAFLGGFRHTRVPQRTWRTRPGCYAGLSIP